MTKREREILSGPISRAIERNPRAWGSLKQQTLHGPESDDFPYYPAALDFAEAAKDAIQRLSAEDKQELIAEWHRIPRLVDRSSDEGILAGYAVVVLDQVVERAKAAAARPTH